MADFFETLFTSIFGPVLKLRSRTCESSDCSVKKVSWKDLRTSVTRGSLWLSVAMKRGDTDMKGALENARCGIEHARPAGAFR